jgi:nucleotide-binding universal stress UspA family protein
MRSHPIVICFDGTPASEHALREAAGLLAPGPAVVVFVWEAGRAFDLLDVPAKALELPPVTVDVRTAIRIDQAMYETAQRVAQRGVELATESGFHAHGLAVADDVTVADTLIRVVGEVGGQAVVVGAHGHGLIREMVLGSTSRDLIRRAPCPVVVVREQKRDG